MNITIVGFGNIAHALIACMNRKNINKVFVLSRSSKDAISIKADYNDSVGIIDYITFFAEDIIPKSDIILFTVPSFARVDYLKKIAPFVKENCLIGAFPGIGGFNEEVLSIISDKNVNIFASQRVPYIARIIKKGESVHVTPKNSINIAVQKEHKKIQDILKDILQMEIYLLDDFMEVNLSNSNPILHTARLYVLFNRNRIYDREVLFYEEWDNESSNILLKMDAEFMQIVNKLNLKNIKSLKEHYEVSNIDEMTDKIKSIKAFYGIKAPLIKKNNVYLPDINSRYFIEDVNIGLKYIKDYANKIKIKTPTIDLVYNTLSNLIKDYR